MLTENQSTRILHILDHSLPLHSGYAFRSHSILQAQRKRGWQPFALTSPKHEENWKVPGESDEEIDGFHYYRTGAVASLSIPFASELRVMKILARRTRELATRERPHVLHAHSSVLNALPAIWVGRSLSLPVVYEIRAFWEDAAVDHGTYRQGSWKYKMTRLLETLACRQAREVVVICQGLKYDLTSRGIPAHKISVVFNGINPDEFHACEPDAEYLRSWNLQGKTVVGFIGSFYRYEGLAMLVEVMSRLVVKNPDVVLLLVGGGEVEQELKKKISDHNLEEKVILPGRVPHERIPGVYALIDILVYPRYSMRLTELVTPLKPLEAMAMGKALVASDIGGHRELIQDGRNGFLFPAGNPLALAELLERLIENPALCRQVGAQGRAWVSQQHSWDRTTLVYNDVYARIREKFGGELKNENQLVSTP